MLNLKCFFKPTLVDIAKNELYTAERALLSANIYKSFCESEITYNTARIAHLRAAIGDTETSAFKAYCKTVSARSIVPDAQGLDPMTGEMLR